MRDEVLTKFGESLRGTSSGATDPDYDDARKLYNGMIDKRPRLIARCVDVGRRHHGGELRPRPAACSSPSAAAATTARALAAATTAW